MMPPPRLKIERPVSILYQEPIKVDPFSKWVAPRPSVCVKLDHLSLLLRDHLEAVTRWHEQEASSSKSSNPQTKPRLGHLLSPADQALLTRCNIGGQYLSWATTLTQQWRRVEIPRLIHKSVVVKLAPFYRDVHQRYMKKRTEKHKSSELAVLRRPITRPGALPATKGLIAEASGPMVERLHFHGTPDPANVGKIMREGFLPSTGAELWHGQGVYLAVNATYPYDGFNGKGNERVLIGALALAHEKESFVDMVCIRDPHRVLPFCTLTYSLAPT
jgi:hypothetical protein